MPTKYVGRMKLSIFTDMNCMRSVVLFFILSFLSNNLQCQIFNWSTEGYSTNSGGGFFPNVDFSGVDLQVSGLSNDYLYSPDFIITGINNQKKQGVVHTYTFRFSEEVDVNFTIKDINQNSIANCYYDLLTFSGTPVFKSIRNVSVDSNIVTPGVKFDGSVKVYYYGVKEFSIVHGDKEACNPGMLHLYPFYFTKNNAPPKVNLGDDRSLCENDTLRLNVQSTGASYKWNDNSTEADFVITESGKYWVEVSNEFGTSTDTLNVKFYAYPVIDLPSDTSMCEGDTLLLAVSNPDYEYLWTNDRSTQSYLQVFRGGTYKLKATSGTCESEKKINVNMNLKSKLDLGTEFRICEEDPITLNATLPNAQYLWQDGSTDSIYTVSASGDYEVKITRDDCTETHSVKVVSQICNAILELPNVITPNGDGKNELFKPIFSKGISQMKTSISNRWGSLVFETTDPLIVWDGGNNSDGTYFWYIEYSDSFGVIHKMNGYVLIVR